MNVTSAVTSRISCRAFLDTPVPKQTLVDILECAKRAPSGGNLQPWLVYALTGQPLADFLATIRSKQSLLPVGEGTEYNIYPPELHDPYRARRFKCGEDLYATINVPRSDRPARLRQFARNYEFFGAPVGLFFCIDRRMGQDQWADVGMFMQTVMLLARERGLHTCAQEAWAVWHKTIAEVLSLPPHVMLFSGMALGYMDESAPINSLRIERAVLEEFATLRGFES
ncbi:nitroreductase [Steroidobacter flavus]|uniref:Nitroreductase n=1 Tax=Steroidobacter flavus TaxID=1842136 RepID=A0ABV8STE0_9GAMM